VVVFDNRDAYFYQVDIHGIRALDAFRPHQRRWRAE
jgi:hypothetical protein